MEENKGMEEGRKIIRKYSWFLLIFLILGTAILILASIFLKTSGALLTSWAFYSSALIMIIALIGLFKYKKWGFYIYAVYVLYLTITNIIQSGIDGLTTIIILLIIYGYIIGYRGFYKNLSYFE